MRPCAPGSPSALTTVRTRVLRGSAPTADVFNGARKQSPPAVVRSRPRRCPPCRCDLSIGAPQSHRVLISFNAICTLRSHVCSAAVFPSCVCLCVCVFVRAAPCHARDGARIPSAHLPLSGAVTACARPRVTNFFSQLN
eukprot:IDg17174t1